MRGVSFNNYAKFWTCEQSKWAASVRTFCLFFLLACDTGARCTFGGLQIVFRAF